MLPYNSAAIRAEINDTAFPSVWNLYAVLGIPVTRFIKAFGGQLILCLKLTLVGRIERKLALSRVNDHAHDQVNRVNEDLGKDETFLEVVGTSHLRHKFVE
jgi:hypothetical protein